MLDSSSSNMLQTANTNPNAPGRLICISPRRNTLPDELSCICDNQYLTASTDHSILYQETVLAIAVLTMAVLVDYHTIARQSIFCFAGPSVDNSG